MSYLISQYNVLLLQPEAFLRQSFFTKQFLMNSFKYKSWKNAGTSIPKQGWNWWAEINQATETKGKKANRLDTVGLHFYLQIDSFSFSQSANGKPLCMLPVLFSAACFVFRTWLRLLFILFLPAKGESLACVEWFFDSQQPRPASIIKHSSTPLSLRDHYCQVYGWSEHGDRCAALGVVSEICVFYKHNRSMSVFQQLDWRLVLLGEF